MNFELLLKAVEIAQELAIPSSFVETNCYWCSKDKVTRGKLEFLKEKGLRGILISVNPFYLEYVPFQRIERGIRISKEIWRSYLEYKRLNEAMESFHQASAILLARDRNLKQDLSGKDSVKLL